MLDIIGSRQIHQVGAYCFHQFYTGSKNEFGKLCAVDRGHRHTNQVENIVDSIFGETDLVRLF